MMRRITFISVWEDFVLSTHIQRNLLLALIMGFATTVVAIKFSLVSGHWYLWWPLFVAISYPLTIHGTVFSLWGGSGPGSVYSLFGVYQDAGEHAFSALGLLVYQRARGFAYQGLGLTLFQRADEDVGQLFGVALFQHSAHDAGQIFGLIGIQNAGEEAVQLFGVSLFRHSRMKPDWVYSWLSLNFAFLFSPFIRRKRFA